MNNKEIDLEDIKGGTCFKCGKWKGGDYGMNGEGEQAYHKCNNAVDNKIDEEFDKIYNGDSYSTDFKEDRIKRFIHKVIKQREDELKKEFKGMIPEEDKPKLGSENQDEYVAYSNGWNNCIKYILNKLNK